MADPEHPLIAADRADTAADLIGERLKSEVMVGNSQSAGEAVRRAELVLCSEKNVESFVVAAIEEVVVAGKRDEVRPGQAGFERQMKPVNGVEKEQGPDALVKIFGVPPEIVEGRAFRQQLRQRRLLAETVEGLIAQIGSGGGNDGEESPAHADFCLASSSRSCVRTSSRSWPTRASASCAVSRP